MMGGVDCIISIFNCNAGKYLRAGKLAPGIMGRWASYSCLRRHSSILWKMKKGKIIMDICQCRCSQLEDCIVASQHGACGSKLSPMPPCLCNSHSSLLPGSNCFLLVIFLHRLFTDTDINYNELLLSGRHGKISVLFSITLDVLKSKCWLVSSKALKNMLSVKSGNSLTALRLFYI